MTEVANSKNRMVNRSGNARRSIGTKTKSASKVQATMKKEDLRLHAAILAGPSCRRLSNAEPTQ
jgi:hypothetical protein